jgi:hypothetical protein
MRERLSYRHQYPSQYCPGGEPSGAALPSAARTGREYSESRHNHQPPAEHRCSQQRQKFLHLSLLFYMIISVQKEKNKLELRD